METRAGCASPLAPGGWQKYHARRRRRLCENARGLQPAVVGVDPASQDRIGILVGHRQMFCRWLEAKVTGRFSARALFLHIFERAFVAINFEQHDAVVTALRREKKTTIGS